VKSYRINIIVLFLTVTFCLLITEFIAIAIFTPDKNIVFIDPTTGQYNDYVLVNNSKINYVLKEGSFHGEVNQYHFRDLKSATNNYTNRKIVIIGDSVTFGAEIQIEQRFSDLLEQKLNDADNSTNEVWNLGVPGYNLIQSIEFYRQFGYFLNPGTIVLAINPTDSAASPKVKKSGDLFRLSYPPNIYLYVIPLPEKLNLFMFKHSISYNFLNEKLVIMFNKVGLSNKVRILDYGMSELTEHLTDFNTELRKKNVHLIVIVTPFLYDFDRYPLDYQKFHELIRVICKMNNITHHDFLFEFSNYMPEILKIKEGDSIHLNFYGQELIASKLYELISDNKNKIFKNKVNESNREIIIQDFNKQPKVIFINGNNTGINSTIDEINTNDGKKRVLRLEWKLENKKTVAENIIRLSEFINLNVSNKIISAWIKTEGKGGIISFQLFEVDGDIWTVYNSELLKNKYEGAITIDPNSLRLSKEWSKGDAQFNKERINKYQIEFFSSEDFTAEDQVIYLDDIKLISVE